MKCNFQQFGLMTSFDNIISQRMLLDVLSNVIMWRSHVTWHDTYCIVRRKLPCLLRLGKGRFAAEMLQGEGQCGVTLGGHSGLEW